MLTFEREGGSIGAAAISPDNRHLAVGRWLWSLTAPTAPAVELTGDAIGFLPDGRLVVNGTMLTLAHPDAPHKGAVRFPVAEPVTEVLPDGRLLCASAAGLTITRAAPAAPIEVQVLAPAPYRPTPVPKDPPPLPVAVAPDGRRAVIGMQLPPVHDKGRFALRLYDLPAGLEVSELDVVVGHLAPRGSPLAWSPCGRYIAAVLGARLVVWSAEDGRVRGELEAGGTRLFCWPRFHPGGRFLAAGGANVDGGVYGWNVGTWEELLAFRWPVGPVASVNFSPDGTLAVAVGQQGRILVWDVDG